MPAVLLAIGGVLIVLTLFLAFTIFGMISALLGIVCLVVVHHGQPTGTGCQLTRAEASPPSARVADGATVAGSVASGGLTSSEPCPQCADQPRSALASSGQSTSKRRRGSIAERLGARKGTPVAPLWQSVRDRRHRSSRSAVSHGQLRHLQQPEVGDELFGSPHEPGSVVDVDPRFWRVGGIWIHWGPGAEVAATTAAVGRPGVWHHSCRRR